MAAAVVLLLSGCGGPGTPATPGPPTKPGNDGVVEPSQQASMPSGIVFTDNLSARRTMVTVHDITTGSLLARAAVPKGVLFLDAGAFDATMGRLAYVVDCELRLAVLAGEEYVEAARWEPSQAYGEGPQCFEDPEFSDDGLIRVRVGEGRTPGRIMAVDPAAPATAPKDEGDVSERKEKILRIPGVTDGRVRLQQAGEQIFSVSAEGRIPGSETLDSFSYRCSARLDDTRRLCGSEYEDDRQLYGSVAMLTLDLGVGTATFEQIAPKSKARSPKVLIAPDGKTIAIHDSTGWYTTTLDGGGTPARQPLSDAGNPGKALFWH
ncbi:hypothetical protein AB0G04_32975 [Actinoplanes sp. NPDC023801]|uniref:hypothetical protein n=1 Tax=Actinoplanes sp. NPDC023801 TaxID=3154595 RepID=UPI0034021385